jgi:hypothetical protein
LGGHDWLLHNGCRLRKKEFELVEASGPAMLVAVAGCFVEELLMDQREQ